MKNYYKLSVILVILLLSSQLLSANWKRSENESTFIQQENKSFFTQQTQKTQQSISDSLPAGFTKEVIKDLRDENGNRVYKEDEGDAMQQTNFNGFVVADQYAAAVSSAGDVNGDGYDDVIIGAPYNDAVAGQSGRAYIYFGGILINNTADVILTGEAINNFFGTSVSSAGDVNGDGYYDVIVGAYGYASNIGKAYIYYGGSVMNNVADVSFVGGGANFNFGKDVSSAGDVNGDGYSDVIIGAEGYNSNRGRAYIYYGGSAMDNSVDVTLTGEALSNYFGNSVSNAGDLNGDGFADVIVGAYAYTTSTGRAYIYYGGTAMDNTADVTLTGEAVSSNFGFSVSGGGDINGDGYADVIVGAYGYSSGTGRAYAFYGGTAMNSVADVTMTGEIAGDFFGYSVSNAGDVNGDGYSDIISGAYAYSTSLGRAYLFYGGTSMNSVSDITLNGEAINTQYGIAVSNAGDVNGDGYSDLITGANGYNGSTGRAYVYTNTLNGADIQDVTLSGVSVNDNSGISVSNAGDVNGDGYSDIIVGAFGYSSNTGRAYIFYGGVNMDNTADVLLTGTAVNNYFGCSVSTAGDINGDGFSDVIIGAYGYSTNTGRAYIYYGGISMDGVADVTMTGEAINNSFGYSVSDAGDVNGDGYPDVIIGSYGYNSNAGRVYIYFGGSPMNNSSDLTLTGTNGSNMGISVSGAGDLNGDGYSDVIAGASGFNGSTGRIYIYYGGSSMNNTADITLTGEAAGNSFGVSVSFAGDVNKDGFTDVIAGANGYNSGKGRAYILYGGSVMDSVADIVMNGEATGSYFGYSVSTAGDVNSDGYSDIIVGSFLNNSSAGSVYIYYGSSSMNNISDITMSGETLNQLGVSVSDAGDVNGDGVQDVVAGANLFNTNTGRSYVYMSSPPSVKPNIQYVRDVPNDQGGYVNVRWSRSSFDISGMNMITQYLLERSLPPGGGGYAWQTVATVNATLNPQYIYAAQTLSDSGAGNNTFYFRVTAKTSDNNVFWRSNILSGYSLDNLAPLPPSALAAAQSGSVINLIWNQNLENDLKRYIIYRNGIQIGTSTTLLFTDNTAIFDSTYSYTIAAQDIHGNISGISNISVVTMTASTIDIKLIIEGFYIAGTNTLSTTDTVRAYLHSNISPYGLLDSAKSTIDPVTLTGSFKFYNAPNGTYYIAVKHRNTIETWSKSGGDSFVSGTLMNYNFVNLITKAFGSNMKLVNTTPSRYGLFSGDVNQDGTIDAADLSQVENDAAVSLSGYVSSDVTGDDFVDAGDVSILENNVALGVNVITP